MHANQFGTGRAGGSTVAAQRRAEIKKRAVKLLHLKRVGGQVSKVIKMFFNGFHTYGKSMMKNWFSKSRSNLFVSTMMTPRKMMSTMASVIRVWWKLDFISGLVIEIVDDNDY